MHHYGFGCNIHGQLGAEGKVWWHPQLLSEEEPIVECGWSFTRFQDTLLGIDHANENPGHTLQIRSGQVNAYGDNRFGQCGTLDRSDKTIFDDDTEIIKVVTGHLHSAAISRLGDVYTWGSNQFGQLGQDDNSILEKDPQFIELGDDTDVIDVVCGSKHTLVLTNNGLFGAGSSKYWRAKIGSWRLTTLHEIRGDSLVSVQKWRSARRSLIYWTATRSPQCTQEDGIPSFHLHRYLRSILDLIYQVSYAIKRHQVDAFSHLRMILLNLLDVALDEDQQTTESGLLFRNGKSKCLPR